MDLSRDQNFRTIGGGVNKNATSTVLPLKVDPATDRLLVIITPEDRVTTPSTMDRRDQNFKPTMYGVSSVDGVTPVPIRTDELGRVLVDIEFT